MAIPDDAMAFILAREQYMVCRQLGDQLREVVTHQMARVRAGELRVLYAASAVGMLPSEMLAIYRHCTPSCDWLFPPGQE